MKIIRALKDDHGIIRKLFRDAVETPDLPIEDRKLVFVELRARLLAHAEAEERALYGPLEEAHQLHAEVMEGREEHRVCSLLLDELSQAALEDDVWTAKLKVLKDLMTHHLDEEESELFPNAKRVFQKDQAKFLGEVYRDARDSVVVDAPRSP